MEKYKIPAKKLNPAMAKAQKKARAALQNYFRSKSGLQIQVSRATGIAQAILSNMANRDDYPIAMEAAILIELATEGALKAEQLCPARADVIQRFLASREVSKEA